jgi:uncharacterized protein (TIGR01777 family)
MRDQRKVVVTGASGLVGQALCRQLTTLGYAVVPYRSRHTGPRGFDAASGTIDRSGLEGAYAVIHLAGESIAQRWTTAAKTRILQSRTESTLLLAKTLAGLAQKPAVFISMSGISRYGSRHAETVDENSPTVVDGFLSSVTEAWETATAPAAAAGIRTILMRTGMVLSRHGGGLAKMLPAFRLGLGGPIGGGRQRLSWIGLPDLVALIIWAMENAAIQGPLNAVSPQPVTQGEFARTLGATLGRPSFLPTPGWAVSLLFGQMGRETILDDLSARPTRALEGGFGFGAPDLATALRQALAG